MYHFNTTCGQNQGDSREQERQQAAEGRFTPTGATGVQKKGNKKAKKW